MPQNATTETALDGALNKVPTLSRSCSENSPLVYGERETSMGRLIMAATDQGLCFLAVEEISHAADDSCMQSIQAAFPHAAPSPGAQTAASPRKQWLEHWMQLPEEDLLSGGAPADWPLDWRGTPFQAEVWRYLRTIPRGETRTYAQLAQGVGRPNAVRAAASACAANRLALVIPCHRVIRSDGELGGYRWGLDLKRRLLEREAPFGGGVRHVSPDELR